MPSRRTHRKFADIARSRARPEYTSKHDSRGSSIFARRNEAPGKLPATSPGQESEEIAEISKGEFEGRKPKRQKRVDWNGETCKGIDLARNLCRAPDLSTAQIVDGSTLGGSDPLHGLVLAHGLEPIWWQEDRERRLLKAAHDDKKKKQKKKQKRSRTPSIPGPPSPSPLDPRSYEHLPYSPQDVMISGVEVNCEPESCESFWKKLSKAWDAGVDYETVERRRERFETGEGLEWDDTPPELRCL